MQFYIETGGRYVYPPIRAEPEIWKELTAGRNGGFLMCKNGTNRENPVFYIGLSSDYMAFFASAINILQTLVVAIGAGLAVWGVINLLEGYGNDNPGAKSQGIKQLMAGGGVVLIGTQLIPLLGGLF